MTQPLLRVDGLSVRFGATTAVHDVSFDVSPGEIVAIVGESGSGKTTIGRAILGFTPAAEGELVFDGAPLPAKRDTATRRAIQMVFQDPFLSLNPRLTIWAMLRELVQVHRLVPRDQIDDRVRHLLSQVSLTEELARHRPSRLSGGQRQRAAIARALAVEPRLIVADEPTSALDVSVQSAILRLFASLRDELGLGIVIISHDLALVRFLSDRVIVLQQGVIVEQGPVADIFDRPTHPYTRALLAAVPVLPDYVYTTRQ